MSFCSPTPAPEAATWSCGESPVQSNNCRQTAAGCAKLGLECRLYLSAGMSKTEPQGNLLLDYLVGAKVEFTNASIGPELDAFLAARADEFRKAGRKPYVWDRSRVVPLAAVSYALCMAEIAEQCQELGIQPDALYVSLAGATGAGVALGKALLGLPYPTRLICPMHWPWHIPTAMANDANAAAERLGLPHRLSAALSMPTSHLWRPATASPHPQDRKPCISWRQRRRSCSIRSTPPRRSPP